MPRKWSDLEKKMPSRSRKRVRQQLQSTIDAMPLAEIRNRVGMTQVELAARMKRGQGTISKMERAADMQISTLRRMVEAMGGALSVTVHLPDDQDVRIDQFSTPISKRTRKRA